MPACMTEVTIEYCVPCGYRDRAVDLERAILGALERQLDKLTLEMGDNGVFIVRADGEIVYDKEEDGFDIDGIVRDVRKQL